MPICRIPHDWQPRPYQRPAWDAWEKGCKRQLLFWHRRAGKDELNLHQHAVAALTRVGTYWHMLPEYSQARKAIWDAVNPGGLRRIDAAFPRELIANRNEQSMFLRFHNGSTFQVVGSDNYNSLVGTPPVGLTFSEWALCNPTSWAYLSPILAENGGWASFISTPRGNNHAKKMYDVVRHRADWFTQVLSVEDTGAISAEAIEEQRVTYAALFGDDVADMLVQQEFYCSFAGALVGSYWGSLIDAADKEGRIGSFPEVPGLPVHTSWDLGVGDDTALWCFQIVEGVVRVIDCYSARGVGAEHYVEWLTERGYDGWDLVPHDIEVKEWGSGRTRAETLVGLKRKVRRVPRVKLADGLQAARVTIPRAVFNVAPPGASKDTPGCAPGLDALRAYRREWDDEHKVFRNKPLHDWASDYADSWRYLSLGWIDHVAPVKPKPKPMLPGYVQLAGPPIAPSTVRIKI